MHSQTSFISTTPPLTTIPVTSHCSAQGAYPTDDIHDACAHPLKMGLVLELSSMSCFQIMAKLRLSDSIILILISY